MIARKHQVFAERYGWTNSPGQRHESNFLDAVRLRVRLSGLDAEPDGAHVVAPGGLGERLGRRRSWRVNLDAEHPLCPLYAELVDTTSVYGCHGLGIFDQLPMHPEDVPVEGDL